MIRYMRPSMRNMDHLLEELGSRNWSSEMAFNGANTNWSAVVSFASKLTPIDPN